MGAVSEDLQPGREDLASATAVDFDVVVAGAGPVGLTLANLLGRDGFRVLVAEAREERSDASRAIGVTAPTLATLERLGLLEECLDESVVIREAKVHGDRGRFLGALSFPQRSGRSTGVVSLPQRQLEKILERSARLLDSVSFWRGWRVESYLETGDFIQMGLGAPGSEGRRTVTARWLAACDGANSGLRQQLGLSVRRKRYPVRFAMADFEDRSAFGEEVRLFFTAEGALESFPLPGSRRRWVVQCDLDGDLPGEGELLSAMSRRCGWAPQAADRCGPWSSFAPQRLVCESFSRGRALLCGDAAHVMSPIGGQGMNVGIGDAVAAHACLRQWFDGEGEAPALLRRYDELRRKAFTRASGLSALGMWTGTRKGRLASAVRGSFLKTLLRLPIARRRIARYFAMAGKEGGNGHLARAPTAPALAASPPANETPGDAESSPHLPC